jgi:small subunit ribosomal protein S20
MANTPQARKRIRRNANRAEINGNRLSRIRTFVKKVEAAIAGGDKAAAAEALHAAQPELARGVARGVLHKNTVARKMSRLTKRVASLRFVPCRPYRASTTYRNGTRLVSVTPAAFCFSLRYRPCRHVRAGLVTHKSQISADSRTISKKSAIFQSID